MDKQRKNRQTANPVSTKHNFTFMPPPLHDKQQQKLLAITQHWITRAERLYAQSFPMPDVRFDLRGQAAGQYRGGSRPCIRYNLEMATIQFDAYCLRTPPHEVAHFIIDQLHPGNRPRPHGPEWRELMRAFGLEPSRCHQYNLENVQQRKQRRFTYKCTCREHRLSATRHNRVRHRGVKYHCISCGEVLQQISDG
ncbi:SprT family zinc-dependent metalloprotease [Thiolapillus sp.]